MPSTTSAFIPFSLLLADLGLWSSEIAELGATSDGASILDEIGVRDTGVVETPAATIARFTLVLDRELAIPLFGLADCAVVLGGGSSATAQTELTIEVDLRSLSTIRFVDVTAALRFPATMLAPVVRVGDTFEPDPARTHSEIVFTATVEIGDQTVRLEGAPTLDLGATMVGDSGVVVEATGIELYLDGITVPPGQSAGWRGVHLSSVGLFLPRELAEIVGDLSLTDAYIGNGGFSGSVATEWPTALSAELGGLALSLSRAEVSFVQNALVAAGVEGSVTVPFFDEPVDVAIDLGLDGSLSVGLSAEDGLYEFTRPGLMTVRLDALGFELEQDLFTVVLSGELTPLVGDLDWPSFTVQELSIDSRGNVRLEGGWLDLPSQFALDFNGFQFEITRLGFGRTDDDGRWVGFSGGLKLVDGMPAGASVEGLRVSWYTDGRPPAIGLDGVGVRFEIPGVLEFEGAVSYVELPGPVHRFDGSIRLALTSLGLEIDGRLVVGYDHANGYPFFAIYLGVELPAGIPLWATGLGLFGLAGLFGANMEPGRLPDEPWYGVGPGEGWYKRDPIGVAELTKWTNREGSFAIGAGVTIGTVADNGFTFAGRFLLAIVLPGPIILLEGKANILKERASLSEDPTLRAIMVIDGREGSFLVGLDAHYAFADAGEVIDIGGGAELFFDFADPLAWHLYLGEKDPVERRIRAGIFQLFEANAYFMLDNREIAAGAWIGYDEDWRFGPVRVALQAWIAGDAVLSFKPLHFTGELWLHGGLEASVFGFGFGIGADARVTGEVFDPFQIIMELAFHLSLPWPLRDFDIPLTLRWGPTPTAPPLPLPLKEVAVEHFLTTTSWPLPRTTTPALLAPDHDQDRDGFINAPVGSVGAVPSTAPIVPLDARPHLTFSRSVHDDALVGVNPQPPFPASQPEAGWEWIGDPANNEGPTRMRTGLSEIALERRTGSTWTTLARKGSTPNPAGVDTLYGSWAPVPQLPGGATAPGTAPPVANTKLWLWSRSGFDYTRATTGTWNDWFAGAYPGYPCVPIPKDRRICCDVTNPRSASSPWSCPEHPEFQLGWTTAPTVIGDPTRLCWKRGESVTLRLGRTVKSVDLYVTADSDDVDARCLDLRRYKRSSHPNPFRAEGFTLEVFDHTGAPQPSVEIINADLGGGVTGGVISTGWRLDIDLPIPAGEVEVILLSLGSEVTVEAYDTRGRVLDQQPFTGPRGRPSPVTVTTRGEPIASVAVIAPSDETYLARVCAAVASGGIQVVPVFRDGREGRAVPVSGGVATLDGRDLRDVVVRGRTGGFRVSGFCVVVGLGEDERTTLVALGEHTRDAVATWSQEGFVLQPHSAYRVRIVTTLETRDFPHDAAFNTVREFTEYAHFVTAGPPGLAALSVPVNTPAPEEFASGLDDLTRYVARTVPASDGSGVPARPVFRAYDTGVEFGVDHVDLMYRSGGRDLGLYLFDNNNLPARDATGRVLAMANQWGVTETLAVTESDTAWIDLINASTCVTIDSSTITRTRALTSEGQVLDGDTLYEARLIPLLVHEVFDGYTVGQTVGGTGAVLAAAAGGGWRVHDTGTSLGPSVWTLGAGHIEQRSDIWGGSASAASATKPGTVLVRADDPALPAGDPAQPGNWTDYRLTAILTSDDDDAIGLVVRYRGPGDHYLFTMDRERRYRRLVRVVGGVHTILAADGFTFRPGDNHEVSVEAIGDRLLVYSGGAPVFDVTDATHATGGVGLYAWNNSAARFADIRVDDLRAAAPVVHRYAFTTSRFANLYGQVHSHSDEVWTAALADPVVVAPSAIPLTGLPAVPGDAEARGYADLATRVVGRAALADTAAVETTVATAGGRPAALLVRTAEPVDWARTTLSVSVAPAVPFMPDPVPATGNLKITTYTPGVSVATDESVTVLLRESDDLAGCRVDYRTLPSAVLPAEPPGTVLAAPDLVTPAVEGPPGPRGQRRVGDDWTVTDVGAPAVPSRWEVGGGVIGQYAAGGLGTYAATGDPGWTDVRVRVLASIGAPDVIGVALRWRGPDDHYLFVIDGPTGVRRLLRTAGGVTDRLWQAGGRFPVDEWRELELEAIGTRLRVLLDGAVLVDLHDDALPSGAVALYAGATDSGRFAAVTVAAAAPQWLPYHEFSSVGSPAAGRRVRLLAGRAADLTAAPVTGEVRVFQGFAAADPAALRLPAEGVDLRLVAPDGTVLHARRFPPDAAFAPAPALRVMRAADGTGLVLLRPGARLEPGHHRLHWTYRRDNLAVDPDSVVLREAGDSTDETAHLDVPVGSP